MFILSIFLLGIWFFLQTINVQKDNKKQFGEIRITTCDTIIDFYDLTISIPKNYNFIEENYQNLNVEQLLFSKKCFDELYSTFSISRMIRKNQLSLIQQ